MPINQIIDSITILVARQVCNRSTRIPALPMIGYSQFGKDAEAVKNTGARIKTSLCYRRTPRSVIRCLFNCPGRIRRLRPIPERYCKSYRKKGRTPLHSRTQCSSRTELDSLPYGTYIIPHRRRFQSLHTWCLFQVLVCHFGFMFTPG